MLSKTEIRQLVLEWVADRLDKLSSDHEGKQEFFESVLGSVLARRVELRDHALDELNTLINILNRRAGLHE